MSKVLSCETEKIKARVSIENPIYIVRLWWSKGTPPKIQEHRFEKINQNVLKHVETKEKQDEEFATWSDSQLNEEGARKAVKEFDNVDLVRDREGEFVCGVVSST